MKCVLLAVIFSSCWLSGMEKKIGPERRTSHKKIVVPINHKEIDDYIGKIVLWQNGTRVDPISKEEEALYYFVKLGNKAENLNQYLIYFEANTDKKTGVACSIEQLYRYADQKKSDAK